MNRPTDDQINIGQPSLTNNQATSNIANTSNTQESLPFIVVGTHPENTSNGQGRQNIRRGFSSIRLVFLIIAVILAITTLIVKNSGSSQPKNSFRNNHDYSLYSVPNYIKPDYSWEIESCTSFTCQNAVKEIISSLNTSVDPCENFFEYACQGWQANNPRPTYSPDWSVFSKLEKKTSQVVSEILSKSVFSLSWSTKPSEDFPALKLARNFYQDCMGLSVGTYPQTTTQSYEDLWDVLRKIDQLNSSTYDKAYDDVEPFTFKPMRTKGPNKFKKSYTNLDKDKQIYFVMLDTLNQHGGWPLLQQPGSWNSSKFDLTKAMVTMKQKFASPIFLDLISVQDSLSRLANNSIYISRPSTSGALIDNVIEQADKQAFKTIYALRDFIIGISKELLIFQGKPNINETYLEEKAWDIIAVESELQKASEKKLTQFLTLFME